MRKIRHCKIKVTPKQSERIQEICFANGICWHRKNKNIRHTDRPYLYVEDDIFYGSDTGFFLEESLKEMSAKKFIKKYSKKTEPRKLSSFERKYKKLFRKRKKYLLSRNVSKEIATRQANIYAVKEMRCTTK